MKKHLLTIAVSAAITSPVLANEMETIIVSAARDGILAANNGSSVTLIDAEALALRPNISLADILRSVPGIAVNRTSGVGSQIQLRMRGGEANHVLVFIDGVQVNDPAQGDDFNFAHLLNQDIASIEVVRGPQSALWGSDALSGMIYIHTANGAQGQRLSAFAEGGRDNWRRLGFSTSAGNQDANVRFSFASTDSDGSNASMTGDEQDGYSNDSAKLRGHYAFSDQLSVNASVVYIDSATDFDSLDYRASYDEFWNATPVDPTTYGLPIDADNFSLSTQLYGTAGLDFTSADKRWQHSVNFAYSRGDNDNYTESEWSVTGYDETHSKSTRQHVSLQSSFALNDHHRATAAIEREEQDFSLSSPYQSGDERMNSTGYALQLQGSINPQWHYLLSGRSDHNDGFDNANSYRLSTAYQTNAMTRLRAAVGTGTKNPTFTELYGYSYSFVGNPNLQPESSYSWEVGVDFSLGSDLGNLSFTYFDETLENEIADSYWFDAASEMWQSTSINEPVDSLRHGVEISVDLQLSDQLRAGGAATKLASYQTNVWTGAREVEIRRPENTASAFLHWTSVDTRQSLAFNVDYNGEMKDTFFGVSTETVVLSSYTLLSLQATQQLSDEIQLYGRIENALNRDYQEIYGFNTPGASATLGVRWQH
ncbi:MAG: hypothetical protein RL336_140 [Pseudomonadota bacterium]